MATDHARERPTNRRPPDLARRARLMRVVNVPMRFALGLPFRTPLSRRLMLITFRGRRSGRTYRQPVGYHPDGDTLLTPGGGRWKLNLRPDTPVRARLRGRDVLLWPELIDDPDTIARLLPAMMAANARIAAMLPVRGRDGAIDRARLDPAIAHGFRLVRWHFAPPGRRVL